mmetsp:Transcript_11453/g.28336  ORF Transcript_11453/g.28336 Transcript_11453/m.28336 type:complete len:134 (-) Transcript_11453:147-548(-)
MGHVARALIFLLHSLHFCARAHADPASTNGMHPSISPAHARHARLLQSDAPPSNETNGTTDQPAHGGHGQGGSHRSLDDLLPSGAITAIFVVACIVMVLIFSFGYFPYVSFYKKGGADDIPGRMLDDQEMQHA